MRRPPTLAELLNGPPPCPDCGEPMAPTADGFGCADAKCDGFEGETPRFADAPAVRMVLDAIVDELQVSLSSREGCADAAGRDRRIELAREHALKASGLREAIEIIRSAVRGDA